MSLLEQKPNEARFSMSWNEVTKETLVFQFKEQDLPASFHATVTGIRGTEHFEPQTFSFEAVE